jgi:hypothetical protein
MHFHLPKPLHGWREFAGEVGIIVVGVLIALGAEQVVEGAHWRHQVALERSALNFEVRDNLNAVQSRMVLEGCVQRRLAELGDLLGQAKTGEPLQLLGPVGAPIAFEGSKGAWTIATSGDVLSHMPLDEQLAYSNAFDNFRNWDDIMGEERSAWFKLGVLDHPAAMTDADWAGVRQAFAQAVAADRGAYLVGPFIFRTASVGLRPDSPQEMLKTLAADGIGRRVCQPLVAPTPPKNQS